VTDFVEKEEGKTLLIGRRQEKAFTRGRRRKRSAESKSFFGKKCSLGRSEKKREKARPRSAPRRTKGREFNTKRKNKRRGKIDGKVCIEKPGYLQR